MPLAFGLAIALTAAISSAQALTLLDFENANSVYGLNEFDAVTTQFAADYGVRFTTEPGAPTGSSLRLAEKGTNFAGFSSSAGNDTLVTQPGDPDIMGRYFLGGGNSDLFNFRMEFDAPVAFVSASVYDVEATESMEISALDANGNVLAVETLDGSTPGTGDGTAVPFVFNRSNNDIAAVRFVRSATNNLFGFGLDNIEFDTTTDSSPAVPEPNAVLLFGASALLALWRLRRG